MRTKYLAVLCIGLGFAIMVGSGFSLAASPGSSGGGSTNLTVNSGSIKINSFGIGNNTTATSGIVQRINNTQLNVNTSRPYLVWINATDTSGYSAIQYIDVYMYYLNGTSTAAYNGSKGQDMNLYLNLTNNTLSGSHTYSVKMIWPAAGNDPTAWLLGSGGWYKYYNSTTANFTFKFYLGSQIHNGTAPSTTVGDAFAWAVNATVKGDGAISKTATMYFGVNDYESVTIVQDSISGSGAPSSSAVYSLGILILHYSINNNYVLTLEASNLTATVSGHVYTFLRHNIGIFDNTSSATPAFNGSSPLSPYYAASETAAGTTGLPKIGTTTSGEARPFNDTTGPSPGQVSLFGIANSSFALAQKNGIWETITITFVFQVPIGTVAGSYTGSITWRLWAENQAFP
ncbi:MAG: hypothetical protein KIY12_03755 [Thermoplasmata archaeon]|uniref:Uncharacterized protein n=1 Tax=Candidatus Sysuiplasma superficiale TaxID=2823368 RepID=A0A8J7YS15_9ARCH|nr:hypothetical protein [Candidatus Sysuiplasma superficiale]MBX8643823.1 hypothetical protein [Candidatus Sysuiplasma superficiale]